MSNQEREEAILAILGDFKSGKITFKQAVEEIDQAYEFFKKA